MAERFLTDFELMVMLAARPRRCLRGVDASRLGESTTERGGRAKKPFTVTPDGRAAIRRTRGAFIATGIPELKGRPA